MRKHAFAVSYESQTFAVLADNEHEARELAKQLREDAPQPAATAHDFGMFDDGKKP